MSSRTPEAIRTELIKSAIASISIPDGIYKKAMERYDSVAKFLDTPGTTIGDWKPDIYVQGSAALGLAIKPPGRNDFDFDVTCEMSPPTWRAAMSVRQELEKRLREDANYSRMLNTDKNRCLRLDYAADEQFHLDIVIARVAKWVSATGTGIEVTDRQIAAWVMSDPRGFIAWFRLRNMLVKTDHWRTTGHSSTLIAANAEPAPAQPSAMEKRALQWVIQIMKRHRDLMFLGRAGADMPISMIITTLAAKAYEGESEIESALVGVAGRMLDQFDDAARWTVLNPVIQSENFADKWPRHPERRKAFFEWHAKFQKDLETFLGATKLVSIADSLETLVGTRPKLAAFNAHTGAMNELQRNGQLGVLSKAATIVPAVVSGSRAIPYHNNYGVE